MLKMRIHPCLDPFAMYQNNPAYMYPQQHQMQHHQQQHQMQQQHQQQMQMHQRQQQLQMQHQMRQQQMHQHQQQQQILQARKKQIRDKQEQDKAQKVKFDKSEDYEDDGEEDDGDDDDDDYDDDDEEDDGEEDHGADDDADDDDDDEEQDDDESFSSLSDLSDSESDDADSESDDARNKAKTKSKLNTKTKKSSPSSKSAPTPKSSPSSTSTSTSKSKSKSTSRSTSTSKSRSTSNATPSADTGGDDVDAGADDMTREMEKLAVTNASPARIPSSAAALSPAEYMYGVISDVLGTNNKKNFQRILSRTPIPIALVYLHQIAQKAIATGNRDIYKVVIDTNKKYNIVSDLYIDALSKGERASITNAMDYLGKTVNAFRTGAAFNIDELLKFFTPEFIAMNLIQAGNIEAYDKVMTEFKNEEIRISRGFHVAKPLLAAYFGVPGFFSNQKRYTFNRDIIVLAICGGSVETLDYVIKKTKMGKISHDIVLEARSCQPIPGHMMKHLIEKYNVSEMSV